MAGRGYRKGISIIVNHLPPDMRRREIEDYFSQVGPVKRCHMVRDKNGEPKGLAYIIFHEDKYAVEAVKRLNSCTINGKHVKVKFSNRKHNKMLDDPSAIKSEDGEEKLGHGSLRFGNYRLDYGPMDIGEDADDCRDGDEEKSGQNYKEDNEEDYRRKHKQFGPNDRKWKTETEQDDGGIKKEKPNPRRNRDGRIIIRNLSFKADEKVVEEHFAPYGNITEVSILRKSDGKMVGCAFVQYTKRSEALQAIQECNMKPLLGRPVAVDLCVPKEKFAPKEVKVEVKKEDGDVKVEEVVIKDDGDEKMFNDIPIDYKDVKIKEEKMSDDDDDAEVKREGMSSNDDDEKVKRERMSSDDDDDSGVEDESDNDDDEPSTRKDTKRQHTKDASRDVAEGRTLFIKNLSFDATEDEIRGILEKFGALKYVLLCIDPLTEHPRGTAFAQFMTRESADECLAAESDAGRKPEFILHGRQMHIMRAVSRNQLTQQQSQKKEKIGKDKRNLYLAREGFVREGTQAAEGVSKPDLQLRMQREQVKRRMLQNLHIFVSPTRLCVNNLPLHVDDNKLYAIFKKHSPAGAKITEARVMRNLKDLDEKGHACSKGYGFVTFTSHEHALTALRNINNNPDIFTFKKRPIVEFSLENQAVLNARKKRMEKSKEKNPLWNKQQEPETKATSPVKSNENHPSFVGTKSDPSNKTLPTNIGPKKTKGKITRRQYRKEQRIRAMGGKKRRRGQGNPTENASPEKKARIEEPGTTEKKTSGRRKTKSLKLQQQRQADRKEQKAFDMMVQNYKQKIAKASKATNAKKWYED